MKGGRGDLVAGECLERMGGVEEDVFEDDDGGLTVMVNRKTNMVETKKGKKPNFRNQERWKKEEKGR